MAGNLVLNKEEISCLAGWLSEALYENGPELLDWMHTGGRDEVLIVTKACATVSVLR